MADERGWRELAGDLPLGVTVAALVSVGLQVVVDRLRIPLATNVPLVLLALTAAALATMVVLLVRRSTATIRPLCWVALSALGTLPSALLLHGSRFYFNGIAGDQSFRTQYMTRFAQSPVLTDINYADLPPFYPAGWFWVGGRIAAVLGIPGWVAYKPFALMTMAVAPVIAFSLWGLVVRHRVAFAHAVLTCLVGVRMAAYEPYAWLVAANIPPMSVLAWHTLRRVADGARRAPAPLIITGAFLGLSGVTYTLLAGFFALVLMGLAACAVVAGWWGRDDSPRHLLPTVARMCRCVLVIGVVAAPLVLAVWTPYLVRLMHTGSSGTGALRFLPDVGALIPTPMLDPSVSGVVCLLGLAWIVLSWWNNRVAQGLGILLACCYLWYLLSFLVLTERITLLPFKLESVLVTALFCACCSGVFDALRWATQRFPHRRDAVLTLGALGAALAMVNLVQTVQQAEERMIGPGMLDNAFNTPDDTGTSAMGLVTPDDPGWWTNRVLAAVRELSRRPAQQQIMLTSDVRFLAFQPYHGFQISDRTYANPLADFDRRRLLVESWSRAPGPEQFRAALDRSPFSPPTVFVLGRDGADLVTQVSRDLFPHNKQTYQVRFPARLFDQRLFLRRDVGPYAVLVRR